MPRERDRANRQPRTTQAKHARQDQDRADHYRRKASETPEARHACLDQDRADYQRRGASETPALVISSVLIQAWVSLLGSL